MHCLKCGKDIGSGLGMCPECAIGKKKSLPTPEPEQEINQEAEEKEETSTEESNSDKPKPSKSLIIAVVLLYILIAIACFVLFWPKSAKHQLQVTVQNNQLVINNQGEGSSLIYDIQQPVELYGRVLTFNPHEPALKQGASFLEVIFLADQDYQKYLSDYLIAERDPAQFLQQTAQWLFLVSDDSTFRAAFSALKAKGGDAIELHGYELSLKEANIEGKTTNVLRGPFQMILPITVDIEGRKLNANTFSQYAQEQQEESLPTQAPQ